MQIPNFDMEGNGYIWTGEQLKIDPTLPIAWIKSVLVDLGFLIMYESPRINKQFRQPRIPCIIVNGPVDLLTSASPEAREALDAVGVLHVVSLFEGETYYGLPYRQDEFDRYIPAPVAEYFAGKILYLHDRGGEIGVFDEDEGYIPVWDAEYFDDESPLLAPIGGAEQCAIYTNSEGEPWQGGIFPSVVNVNHDFLQATFTRTEREDQFVSEIQERAAHCRKYKVVAWSGLDVHDVTVPAIMMCLDPTGSVQSDQVIPDADPIVIGDTQLIVDAQNEVAAEVWDLVGSFATFSTTQPTNSDLLTIAIEFFTTP